MADEGNRTSAIMQYAGLATQLLVLLGLAVWGGLKLDQRMHFRALFVIVFPVLALIISLVQIIRSLNNKKNL
jgi:F0F1-type ATP synthase assembly protein I